MYRVILSFSDKQDNDRKYVVGDTFPRDGLEVTDDRLAELSAKTKFRPPLIEEVEGEKTAEPTPEKVEEADAVEEVETSKKKGGKPKKNAE